ncbi:TetR family transcriptional regulator [Paenibacillus sp. FSL R7-277]|uniref:TetR/AcrR family transcriptional regulator n=1 Tax=unclassified Paenibacillus TaxID=185978 RepID=UPI0003E2844E|nr:TetR/AcrR family transcriptional regulator [Paenibacillus sp. FSL R7-277]ETT76589.1 TetR family transcriptional regulator [Paenibacillus sp. FSL R7-277]
MSTPKGSVKRSMILDQALELFVQKGYAATSMEDIVKHTGVSKGSIYYHFSSKDDLFVSMVEKINREWVEEWSEIRRQFPEVGSRLMGASLHFVNSFQSPLTKVAEEFSMNMQDGYQEIHQRLIEISMVQIEVFTEIFREGMEQQVFTKADSSRLAVLFTSMLSGLTLYPQVFPKDGMHQHTQEAVAVLLEGIKKK